jgi:hypothetical protein
MSVQVSDLLREFAKYYRDEFLTEHPDTELTESDAQVFLLRVLEEVGHAIRHTAPDGTLTWIATPELAGHAGELLLCFKPCDGTYQDDEAILIEQLDKLRFLPVNKKVQFN